MKQNLRMAMVLGAAFCGFAVQLDCLAQSARPNSDRTAAAQSVTAASKVQSDSTEIAALEGPGSEPGAPAGETSASASAAATPGATPASILPAVDHTAVVKELAEMKARIAQLESELKASNGAADADRDANALRSAEGVAVSGASSDSSLPAMQAAPAPAAAATPAPPEINAQTTTKGEPFDGDWTWLNSNGHAVDSPMSTKYFTPEFRADANYTLDMNHPHEPSPLHEPRNWKRPPHPFRQRPPPPHPLA